MRLQQWIAKNDEELKKYKGININENTLETSKDYVGSYHVLEMGQHYLEYRKPENLFTELGKTFKDFPATDLFRKLENKTRASVITGNIGEMIAGIVASRTLKFPTDGIGHLIVSKGRTPDYLLKNNKDFEKFLIDTKLANNYEVKKFPEWWLMESKASSISRTVSLTDAYHQLLNFWYRMQDEYPEGLGYGIAVGTSIYKKTIDIRIYIPQDQKALIVYFKELKKILELFPDKKDRNTKLSSTYNDVLNSVLGVPSALDWLKY